MQGIESSTITSSLLFWPTNNLSIFTVFVSFSIDCYDIEGVSKYIAIFTGKILSHWIQHTTERCDSMELNYVQYFAKFSKKFSECKVICLFQFPTLNMLEIWDTVRLIVNIFACKTYPTNK